MLQNQCTSNIRISILSDIFIFFIEKIRLLTTSGTGSPAITFAFDRDTIHSCIVIMFSLVSDHKHNYIKLNLVADWLCFIHPWIYSMYFAKLPSLHAHIALMLHWTEHQNIWRLLNQEGIQHSSKNTTASKATNLYNMCKVSTHNDRISFIKENTPILHVYAILLNPYSTLDVLPRVEEWIVSAPLRRNIY